MTLELPLETVFILHSLQKAGFSGYIVGGAVRDLILAQEHGETIEVTDFDFTTNATPEEISQLFPESFYENDFGTVSITHDHLREQLGLPPQKMAAESSEQKIDVGAATKLHPSLKMKSKETDATVLPPYEITTFRSDGEYNDFRRPTSVEWGKTLEEDLERRDFTINSMAIEVDAQLLARTFEGTATTAQDLVQIEESMFTITDPHHGTEDLKNKLIRTVGEPQKRFQEDALRMLRAIRFSVQLGFEIEEKTMDAIYDNCKLLEHISGERIRDEFFKMLVSPQPKKAIEMLDQTQLLGTFLPELLEAKGVEQSGHHTTDVWTHSLDALQECPSPDPVVRLATLLHDISKPATAKRGKNGNVTFYNHEVLGARVGKAVAERLKLSKKDINRVFILIRLHMFHYQPTNTDAAIRRFMRRVGLDNLNDILDLREADRLGSGAKKTSWRLEEMKQRIEDQLHQPFDVDDLAIDGHDLIQELQLQPGPAFREILQTLLEEVLDKPELNEKSTLLERAKQLSKQS